LTRSFKMICSLQPVTHAVQRQTEQLSHHRHFWRIGRNRTEDLFGVLPSLSLKGFERFG